MHTLFAFILLQVNLLFPPDSLINHHEREAADFPKIESVKLICKPDDKVVAGITLIGNAKTRESILLRELLFSENDTINKEQLLTLIEKSKINLMNTGLFHSAEINYIENGDGSINVVILVSERWYLWPFPIVELADRNFNAWWLTKDLSHVNIGMYLIKVNFRGNKESIVLRFKWGFTRQVGLNYNIPFINKNQRLGMGFFANYSRNKQIILSTVNNKLIFYDKIQDYVRREFNGGVTVNYRKGFYVSQSFTAKYTHTSITDTIKFANPLYLGPNLNTLQFITLEYGLKNDKRDYKPYPLKGSYCDLLLSHNSFPFKLNYPLNMTTLTMSYRKYSNWSDRIYAATMIKGKVSSPGFQPFYVQRGLGYFGDYVRGYEYYAFDGQHFVLNKSSLKYNLVKANKFNINALKNTGFATFRYAFYLDAFVDGGYVWDKQFDSYNKYTNQLQLGSGIGLDFLTSNDLVIRFEYSINKFAEHAFYLHAGAPF